SATGSPTPWSCWRPWPPRARGSPRRSPGSSARPAGGTPTTGWTCTFPATSPHRRWSSAWRRAATRSPAGRWTRWSTSTASSSTWPALVPSRPGCCSAPAAPSRCCGSTARRPGRRTSRRSSPRPSAWCSGPPPEERLQRDQFLGAVGEHLVAILGHEHQVLDAQSREAEDVDAGLDRHDHAGLQHVIGALREAWSLVYLQTRTVAEAVREVLGQALFGQVVAGDGVYLAARLAGRHGCDAALLGTQHGVVQPL